MKHLLLFLSCCLLATSCSKDETPTSDELVGTVWSQVDEDRTDTIYFAADHTKGQKRRRTRMKTEALAKVILEGTALLVAVLMMGSFLLACR